MRDETIDETTLAVASALQLGISLVLRRLRQIKAEAGELTMPESSALSRLDRGGPTTVAALAGHEQISSQSMGATIAALEARSLVDRRPDPSDGRRAVIAITAAGRDVLRRHRTANAERIARALSDGFTADEREQLRVAAPLIERLADRI